MPPAATWTTWPLGVRVVVRYRLEDGRFSEALGDLVAATEEEVTVATRRGLVRIPAGLVAIAKQVPPRR
jgi:hypothetical protein